MVSRGHTNVVDSIIHGYPDSTIIFVNDEGYSMHFVILLREKNQEVELRKKLESHCAGVSFTTNVMSPYSAVLVDSDVYNWNYNKEVFKLEYLEQCFRGNRIVSINPFRRKSDQIKDNFDFMSIFYFRKYTWETIPPEFLKSSQYRVREEGSDEDSNEDNSAREGITKKQDPNKHTRLPYSRKEDEAILKFIVDKKYYKKVKGNCIWQELDDKGTVPTRTWSSLKDHYRRTLIKQLDKFHFLTDKQKKLMRDYKPK